MQHYHLRRFCLGFTLRNSYGRSYVLDPSCTLSIGYVGTEIEVHAQYF
jgi:hypothetical protein